MISWLTNRVQADSTFVALAALAERLRSGPSIPLTSCSHVSGTCGNCNFGGAPCGGFEFCYQYGQTCTGVHLDACPVGYTSTGRWWCCCDGSLVDCTDCEKSGQPFCICQGDYDISC